MLPLGTILKYHEVQYHIYADDAQIYMSFKLNDPQCAIDNINKCKIQHNCLTKTEAFIIYTCQLFTSTYYRFALHIKQIINEAIQSCQFKNFHIIVYSNLALYTLNKILHFKIKGELVISIYNLFLVVK